MERIVALDPGGTTGWASVQWRDDGVYEWEIGHIGPREHHKELYDFLQHWNNDAGFNRTIVCESFEYRREQRDYVELISREYIGVAKLFGNHYDTPVVLQTAGLAKGFIPDKPKNGLEANAKLKVMGLYVPGMKHAMDARRHLIYYMVNKKKRVDLIESWKDLM